MSAAPARPVCEAPTAIEVVVTLLRRPVLVCRSWNWKSAVVSSVARASLFFAVNLSAGRHAAFAAFLTELAFRATTAGFYGALTEAFRPVQPAWAALLTASVLLPVVTHSLEFAVHWARGTPNLAASMLASALATAFSTAFNLYAMRRGVFIVGRGARPLWHDLLRLPMLYRDFARDAIRWCLRAPMRDVAAK